MTTDRFEFCSVEWVRCLRSYIAGHLADLDLSGVTMSFSKELINPPPHLVTKGATSLGWHFRLADGALSVEESPLREADQRMVGDNATVVELARLPYSDSEIGTLAQKALDQGTLLYEGDASGADRRVVRAIKGLHDHLAQRTA